jgi:DNA-binding MarR family transcriptional regulator
MLSRVASIHRDETFELTPALEFLQCLWRLNHSLERLSARMERKLGVTAPQRLIIRCVGAYPGLTASDLAQLLHVDPGTISASLKKLEASEVILRRQDTTDKRRFRLLLTRKGRSLDRPTRGTAEHAVENLLAGKERGSARSTKAMLEELARLLDLE